MERKIIIYPASRQLLSKEQKSITKEISIFLENWTAHRKKLSAEIKIQYHQFIIILINENIEPASGCSLDALDKMMKEIEQKYSLGIFDRMKACFIENNLIKTMNLQDFKRKLKNEEISKNISVFDFSKSNENDFNQNFLLPLKNSWASTI